MHGLLCSTDKITFSLYFPNRQVRYTVLFCMVNINDQRIQLDVSASQKISNGFSVFAEVMNLTNAPLRYYNGTTSRPEQQEFYSWWGNLGVKFNF